MKAGSHTAKRIIYSLILGMAGSILVLVVWSMGWLDIWEFKTWDWRASLLARPGRATNDIIIIKLDQNSLDWGKRENALSWPWPRELYAAILDFCRRNEAKAVALDVLFTEPSREGVYDDQILGTSISRCKHVAAALFLGNTTGSETVWPDDITTPAFTIIGLNDWLRTTDTKGIVFPRATFPIPEVAHAALLCNVHMEPDRDGIYRRIKLFNVFNKQTIPSLGLGAYLTVNPSVFAGIDVGKLHIDNKAIPIDDAGNVILRYRGPAGTYKTFTAAEVIQSELRFREGEKPPIANTNTFKDKYVLFGFTAPGLLDLRSSPVEAVYPGVEIHAVVLDNFLSGDFMCKVPSWLTVALVIILGVVSALSIAFISNVFGGVLLSFFSIGTPVVMSIVSYIYGYWLPLIVLETVAVTSITASLVVNYATEGKQKRFIKSAFKQYLSPAVIEQLIRKPELLKLGGERKVLSIFFSDLEGFTSISEHLAPEDLAGLLNEYLSAMTDIIHEEGGTVDKYEGDAIIAFWNAPLETAGHAVRAVRAALRCQEKLAEMQLTFKERFGKELRMRVGINTGPAVVGNLGSYTRFDYTIVGDAVNLAARLEGVNKQFGTYTMISETTQRELNDAFPVRELGRLIVVGRTEPVTVYEPLIAKEFEGRRKILDVYSHGLDLFYKGRFAQARDVFISLKDVDSASEAYADKCEEYIELPPKNWQGVWVMSTKK